jgi:predicted O-linked N-acetylglucosamine transferase (SPINDLY family)
VTVFQPARASPAVGPLPALARDAFTFASLNHLAKVTPETLAVWARLLAGTPGSILVVANAGDPLARDRLAGAFAARGVSEAQLDFRPRLPLAKFLALHQEIDLALDPFPYNGGATSCHSLWMGVPFVTLAGDRYMARMGTSLLEAAGLGEFVARTPEEYVALAARLARDRSRLAATRATLRERLAASPLMNAPEFVRSVERAYRDMWRTWCGRDRAASGSDSG